MTTIPAGWEGILDDDESILWQGRPGGGVLWSDLLKFETFFGLFFAGFAVFWIYGAATMGRSVGTSGAGLIPMLFPLFGIPFVVVGLHMVVGRLFWDAYLRGQTWYTLSDKAAYIATETLGKRALKRYPFEDMVPPSLDDGQPGSVWFAEELRTHTSRRRHSTARGTSYSGPTRTRVTRIPVGFRRIDGARAVFRLINEHRTPGD